MPDQSAHGAAANLVLFAMQTSNAYVYEWGSLPTAAALGFIVGSYVPDLIGCLGYAILGKIRGRGLDIFPNRWEARIFNWVDKKTRWGVPYKFSHSLVCMPSSVFIVYAFFGGAVASGFLAAVLLHLLMDLLTHEHSWLLWPAKNRPMKVNAPNWWKYRRYRSNARSLALVGLPTNIGFSYMLTFGLPL